MKLGLVLLVMVNSLAFADCAKCVAVREYNAQHPENNYTYYEDYLKDQQLKENKSGTGTHTGTNPKQS